VNEREGIIKHERKMSMHTHKKGAQKNEMDTDTSRMKGNKVPKNGHQKSVHIGEGTLYLEKSLWHVTSGFNGSPFKEGALHALSRDLAEGAGDETMQRPQK
jgi:hypothetical protein